MIDRVGEGLSSMNDVKPKTRQPWSRMITRPGLRRAYFRIQASRNAAPINKTNNHASPASNRATLADIPHKDPTIAAVRSSSALRNDAAPVNGFS